MRQTAQLQRGPSVPSCLPALRQHAVLRGIDVFGHRCFTGTMRAHARGHGELLGARHVGQPGRARRAQHVPARPTMMPPAHIHSPPTHMNT